MTHEESEVINLGDTARDTITGFEGVVIADTRWLNGCRRLTLQPKALHEGKPIESVTFDQEQLVLVEPDKSAAAKQPTGGPHPEPHRAAAPR